MVRYVPYSPFLRCFTGCWYFSCISLGENVIHETDVIVVELAVLGKLLFQPAGSLFDLLDVVRHRNIFIPEGKWHLIVTIGVSYPILYFLKEDLVHVRVTKLITNQSLAKIQFEHLIQRCRGHYFLNFVWHHEMVFEGLFCANFLHDYPIAIHHSVLST